MVGAEYEDHIRMLLTGKKMYMLTGDLESVEYAPNSRYTHDHI